MVSRGPGPELSSTAFPGTLAGSEVGSGVARLEFILDELFGCFVFLRNLLHFIKLSNKYAKLLVLLHYHPLGLHRVYLLADIDPSVSPN